MICYQDEQLRGLETFYHASRALEVMHSEPIDYVIAQVNELVVCWNETVRACKTVLADVVCFPHFSID